MIRLNLQMLFALALSPCFVLAEPAVKPAAEAPAASKSITPAHRLGEGGWKTRWEAKLTATREAKRPEVVFIGDSITQAWEGPGKAAWDEHFAKYEPLNLGFSGDRTEHLLWRLKTDEENLKKLKPKAAVILIGTNNTGHEQRPAADTVAGIKAVLDELQLIWPQAKLLVLSVFPRGADANDGLRKINDEINQQVVKLGNDKTIFVQDLSPLFLAPDGTLPRELFPDLLHLSPKAYEIWASAIDPKLKEFGL